MDEDKPARGGHDGSGGRGAGSGRGSRWQRAGGGTGRGDRGRKDPRGAGRRGDSKGERRRQDAPDRGDRRRAQPGQDSSGGRRTDRGPRSWDHRTSGAGGGRMREPAVPDEITGQELDRSVWTELRTLSKDNAAGVARHLVASAYFMDEDLDRSLRHAEHAASRAGRVAAVREALGLVHYRRGEYADALREFRTARRLSGSHHLLPYMVDCERGLGRLERALELASSPEADKLSQADRIELAIVVSGVRRDLGQARAAVVGLRIPALERADRQPWAARLLYAYAEALLATGDEAGARDWFARAVDADASGETDAADRLDELDGLVMTDLLADEDGDAGEEHDDGNSASSTP